MPYYQFPGSDFHDLNLDWLLQQMKTCLAEWTATKADWQALTADNAAFKARIEAEWDELRQFVTDYFDNLDLSEEVSAKINQMAADGSLLAIIQDTTETVTTQTVQAWLAAHITQETGYVIDNSLSIYGAAADAFYTGAGIRVEDNESHVNIHPRTNTMEHYAFVLGMISYTGGGVSDANNHTRAYSGFLTPLKYGRITASAPYDFAVLVYNSSYAYQGVVGPDGTWAKSASNIKWFTEFDFSRYGYDYNFRIQIRNSSTPTEDLTYEGLAANITVRFTNAFLRFVNQQIVETSLFEDVTNVHQWRNQTLESGTPAASSTNWLTYNAINSWQYPYVYIDKTNLPEGVSDVFMYVYAYDGTSTRGYPYKTNGLVGVAAAGPLVKMDRFYPLQYGANLLQYKIELVAVDSEGNKVLVDGLPARVHFLRSKFYKTNKREEINILFIGNSLTQDAVAYLPYVIKNLYGDQICFRIGIYYNGGYTLSQTYNKFTSGGTAQIFSIAADEETWLNFRNEKTIDQVLSAYTWDIVCLQEYYNLANQTPDAYNNCVNYIINHYTGTNPLKFVELLHAPIRDNATAVYERTVAGCQLTLKETPCEDCINPGTAVYRALSTDLNNLGDAGGLSPDGLHTQEGLPCLLQTFVVLKWVLDMFGIKNKSFYNTSLRINTAAYNSIDVPGANLGSGVIPGTDAQNLLAQRIAINASNEARKIIIDAF